MKKIFIVIMCIFLFGCNNKENINTTSKKVNIQKKSYYAFKVKIDDDISYNENVIEDNSIKTVNISNNLNDEEEMINENKYINEENVENLNNNIEEPDNKIVEIVNETIEKDTDPTTEDEEKKIDTTSIVSNEEETGDDSNISLMSTNIDNIESNEDKSIVTNEEIKPVEVNINQENNDNIQSIEEKKKGYYTTRGTYLGDTKVKVIDISYHQGIIDFDSFVNSDSYYGIILRVGYYNTMDKLFERNINEIKRLNIPYGIYLFSYSTNSSESLIEANFTNSVIDKYDLKPELGIYYDIESWSTKKKSSDNITKETYDSMVTTYINSVSNHVNNNYKVKVYSNRWYAMNRLGEESKSFVDWVAEYNKTCKYDAPYSMWQYTSKGSVPGIKGNVDISYLY